MILKKERQKDRKRGTKKERSKEGKKGEVKKEEREREKKEKSRRSAYPGRVLVTPRLGGGLF